MIDMESVSRESAAYLRGHNDATRDLGKELREAYERGAEDAQPSLAGLIVVCLLGACCGALLPFFISAWIVW